MEVCNMVKIFRKNDPTALEFAINAWFKDNPVLLVDVKLNITQGTYRDIYTAMIIYQ